MADIDKLRLNRIRLDACPRHSFETENVQVAPGQKVRCRECGGVMSLIEANQYVRGYEAAGGDGLEVWAGWKDPGEEVSTTCPQCLGRNYVEPRPNDFFDCDLCESSGYVNVSIARTYLKEQDEC